MKEFGRDDHSTFTFDTTTDTVEYRASAGADGDRVEITVSCPGKDPVVSSTEAGGQWFTVTADMHFTVEGDSMSGSYTGGIATHAWQLTKVE